MLLIWSARVEVYFTLELGVLYDFAEIFLELASVSMEQAFLAIYIMKVNEIFDIDKILVGFFLL